MQGIPGAVYIRLRETLLECDAFESDSQLRSVFIDDLLIAWRDQVPEGKNPNDRVTKVINFLVNKRIAASKENALVAFLRVLSTQIDKADASHQSLLDLAEELNRVFSSASLSSKSRLSVPRRIAQVPFMVDDLPVDFVPRPSEYEELIGTLLNDNREDPVAITAALRGAGGYGKTTIAKAICHDKRIREAFHDGILWVTLGENPGNLIGKVEDLIYVLNRERPGFTGIDMASAYLAKLLSNRDILLVIDDVWNAAHLNPFLQGGKRCARLITTRNDTILPPNAQRITVDAMRQEEAVQLLTAGINHIGYSSSDTSILHNLAAKLGKWPLLLKLANGVLRDRVNKYQQNLPNALAYIHKALDRRGLIAFDANEAESRSQAVAKTLEVSFRLLSRDDYKRYRELAIFPEDIEIPLAALHKLWGITANLDEFDTEELCERLHTLFLLLDFDLSARTIRLHDVMRVYLRREIGDEQIITLNRQFLDTYVRQRWAELPQEEVYLWNHLAYHLVEAKRVDELVRTVKDLRYLSTKTYVCSPYAAEADLNTAKEQVLTDTSLNLLDSNFASMTHILSRCETYEEVGAVLLSRLSHLDDLSEICRALENELPRPLLTTWYPLPDLPSPVLIRTLYGHTGSVNSCAISPLGDYIVSGSDDKTLKVWDAQSGQERFTLYGHTDRVNCCAISPLGDYIVSGSDDRTLKVWDARSGQERFTLYGHTGNVNSCAISPLGDYIVSGSDDRTLRVWDARSGQEHFTLYGHTDRVNCCAISPLGDFIVSGSDDRTLRVWDAQTGDIYLGLAGHRGTITGCSISSTGNFIFSASFDGTIRVWNIRTGEEIFRLNDTTDSLISCQVSHSGDYIVSASWGEVLKIWDASTKKERLTLRGHTNFVTGCAVSPTDDFIVSTSADKTLKIWNPRTESERRILQEQLNAVTDCAISPLGDYIISASPTGLKVWDALTNQEHRIAEGPFEAPVIGCLATLTDDYMITAGNNRPLKVRNAFTGQELFTLQGHTDTVTGCAISPAGDFIVSSSNDKTLKVWEAAGYERLTLQGHTDAVTGCAISPAGDFIVSVSADKSLKVWNAFTGQELFTLQGHTDTVTGCAISSSGDFIVSSSNDKTLKVWEATTGYERLTLRGHTGTVTGCAISPLGNIIASISEDNVFKIWDSYTGNCLTTLIVDGRLTRCVFHPDGEHVISGGVYGLYFLHLLDTSTVARQVPSAFLSKDLKGRIDLNSAQNTRLSDDSDTSELIALMKELKPLQLAIEELSVKRGLEQNDIIRTLADLESRNWHLSDAIVTIWSGGIRIAKTGLNRYENELTQQMLMLFARNVSEMWRREIAAHVKGFIRRYLFEFIWATMKLIEDEKRRSAIQRIWAGERDFETLFKSQNVIGKELIRMILYLLAESSNQQDNYKSPRNHMLHTYYLIIQRSKEAAQLLGNIGLSQLEIQIGLAILTENLANETLEDFFDALSPEEQEKFENEDIDEPTVEHVMDMLGTTRGNFYDLFLTKMEEYLANISENFPKLLESIKLQPWKTPLLMLRNLQ